MYCILITGIPAAGKTTLAQRLSCVLQLPVFSKDAYKETLFDDIGFSSRAEKVQLGVAAMHVLYQTAEAMLKLGVPFILENNFEHVSREALLALLEKYGCTAITVTLTGDYPTIYRRFCARNAAPDRHRGHVVNDRYPEAVPGRIPPPPSLDDFIAGITQRGMDSFAANGPQIVVDATDPQGIDIDEVADKIRRIFGGHPMNLSYRRATITDLDELVRTRIEVLRAANRLDGNTDMTLVEAESRDYYRSALADGSHVAILVHDGARFVGAGGISFYRVMPTYHNPTGRKAYIMNMYTHPDYRRRGIARHTLSLLIDAAHTAGVDAITLEATEMGRKLYSACSFVPLADEMLYNPNF